MFRGSGLGQDITALLLFSCRDGGTCFEAEAVVACLQDVAAVGQAVEECGRHFGIAEDGGPFATAQVRGDDDAGAFVKLAQQPSISNTASLRQDRPRPTAWSPLMV